MQVTSPTTGYDQDVTRRYLSTSEFAARIGVHRHTLTKYKLPPPDALIGTVRGWLPETVDAWQARRPGRGARTAGTWNLSD